MSQRAAWLAFGALSVGLAIASCTGSDGSVSFDNTGADAHGAGGEGAGTGGTTSTAGSKNTGATSSDAGAAPGPHGGQPSGEAGSGTMPGEGGAMSGAGQPGGGGDATFGGMPGGEAGAGGAGPGRDACESIKNCEAGEVCVKAACDAQVEGTCMKAPAAPVCGCDGLTYYDGALAAASSVDVRNNGTCKGEHAVACDGDCKGENVSCGRVELREVSCEAKVEGVCWQLPAECPNLDLSLYNLCGSEKCLPLCEAVEEGLHAVPGALLCAVVD